MSRPIAWIATVVLLTLTPMSAQSAPLEFSQLAAMRNVASVAVSPDGKLVAYTVAIPRVPGQDDDGAAWSELHLAEFAGGESRPFVRGEVNVGSVEFTPDGRLVTYLAKRQGDDHTALWGIPVDGGESYRLLEFGSGISSYAVSPDGSRVAFIAKEPEAKERKKRKDKGYKQEVFEEDWRANHVWVVPLAPMIPEVPTPTPDTANDTAEETEDGGESDDGPRPLEVEGSAFHVAWSPDGASLVLDLAPTPLIDDRYMARKVTVVDAQSGEVRGVLGNAGKLGSFAFSPDGESVALITAADPNDPKEGRLMIGPAGGGPLRDLLPGLVAHVASFVWKDASTIVYVADVGAETELRQVDLTGDGTTLLRSGTTLEGVRAPIVTRLALSDDGSRVGLVGQTPQHPAELWTFEPSDRRLERRTDSNPWLEGVSLGVQEVVKFEARDGLELEGVLIHPVDPGAVPAPLLLMVHGGPEGHDRNGWPTSYSRPGQLAAGRGFAVFYPNYRGSTGRGVTFSKHGQGDAAGKEFDDLIDAVDHLVTAGIADRDRVGVTGGSYGGYATAWCATRFTDRFKAGVMFVGISNKVDKGLTTEIPVEDKMVHTLFDPWTRFDFSLDRSPVNFVAQSRTALLIAGGTADSRVHPSQSLQLYRALKLIGKTPVRYVRYPDEGHGNRRAAGRDDYCRRLIRWMEHYVTGPGGAPPPVELE